jgi:hypothetical protein
MRSLRPSDVPGGGSLVESRMTQADDPTGCPRAADMWKGNWKDAATLEIGIAASAIAGEMDTPSGAASNCTKI